MSTDLRATYDGRRVCVTGGAGFIGSHLAEALVELGAQVTVLDDMSSGSVENLQAIHDRIRLVTGSILDPRALLDAAGGAEVIYHEAALTSVPASVEQPARYHEVNATGTLRVLEAARLGGGGGDTPGRVVYAASSSIYGDRDVDPPAPLVETLEPRPMSPYAAAKGAGEFLVRAYAACYGVPAVSLRYFNIFGPRQRADSPYAAVIPRWAEALRRGDPPIVYGDGTQTRDFTYVGNAVRANLLAGAAPDLAGQAVNIACGSSCTLLELLDRIAARLGLRPKPRFEPLRPGEVMHSRADISAARRLLGYEPVMDLDGGLAETLREDPQVLTRPASR